MLAAAVYVSIKCYIDDSGSVAELAKLVRIEVVSQGAGSIVEPGFPKDGVIEQPLDEDHFRILSNLRPTIQAALHAWQEPVRRCRIRKATAIKIAFQRKDDTTHVSVVSHPEHQTGLTQSRQRVAQVRQPTSQATAGRVADTHELDQRP